MVPVFEPAWYVMEGETARMGLTREQVSRKCTLLALTLHRLLSLKNPIKLNHFVGCDTPCSDAKCSFGCHNSPRGPRCTCPLGFKIAADRVSCEDIDECKQVPPICENYCINTNGSYQCNDFSQGSSHFLTLYRNNLEANRMVYISLCRWRKCSGGSGHSHSCDAPGSCDCHLRGL